MQIKQKKYLEEKVESTEGKKRLSLKKRAIKALLVTAIAGFLAYLIVVPLSESIFSKLFSAPETSDFTMSDMFIQFADSRPVRHLSDSIVMVDIGYAGREEIADALEVVAVAEPKIVGLDVNFAAPKGDVDEYLVSSILMQSEIVLPIGVDLEGNGFEVAEVPFFYDSIQAPNLHYGVANLPAKSARSSIREFETEFTVDGRELPSYVVEIARIGNPEAYNKLKERGNRRENIDYVSREFTIIPIDRLLDRAEELTGKYVLIGSMGDAYDMHATPINSYQAGLVIHANALATLLDGAWYTYIPDWVDYTMAGILCFLLVFGYASFKGRGKGLALRVLQMFLLVLTVWLGYSLFLDHRTLIDLSYTFFVVGLGFLVLEFWNGIEGLFNWIVARTKKARHPKKLENT